MIIPANVAPIVLQLDSSERSFASGEIAGCYVTEGKIVRSKAARLLRNGEEIFKGAIDQLKRFKDDVKEVAQGFECGISFSKWNDIEVGDVIEVTTTEEIERDSL